MRVGVRIVRKFIRDLGGDKTGCAATKDVRIARSRRKSQPRDDRSEQTAIRLREADEEREGGTAQIHDVRESDRSAAIWYAERHRGESWDV